MTYNLFLDDERQPHDVTWVLLPDVEWMIVRDWKEFSNALSLHGVPDFVSFDHDLGSDTLSGKNCASMLVDLCNMSDLPFPQYTIHSMNPIGKENIEGYIRAAKKAGFIK